MAGCLQIDKSDNTHIQNTHTESHTQNTHTKSHTQNSHIQGRVQLMSHQDSLHLIVTNDSTITFRYQNVWIFIQLLYGTIYGSIRYYYMILYATNAFT